MTEDNAQEVVEDEAVEPEAVEPEPTSDLTPTAAVDPVDEKPTQILARSTVHLPGLPLGVTVTVDPRVPYIADCLERQYLVPVVEDEAPLDAEE